MRLMHRNGMNENRVIYCINVLLIVLCRPVPITRVVLLFVTV